MGIFGNNSGGNTYADYSKKMLGMGLTPNQSEYAGSMADGTYGSTMSGLAGGNDMFGGLFGEGGFGLEQIGKGVGIFGDIMGYMNQKKVMEAGINQMNNQTKTSNYNMANNTNFTNGTIDAFGSGQAKSQNQFGSMYN